MKRLYGGVDLLSYGEWAVITGASDGIGRALASQLAKRGFKKILLIARNDNKLKDVATEVFSCCSSHAPVAAVAAVMMLMLRFF